MATTQIKNGFQGGSDDQLLVNPDGSINVNTSGGGGGNASVGPTGVTAPTSATEVGAIDPSGNLVGLKTDVGGKLLVNVTGDITGTVTSNVAGLGVFKTTKYTIGITPIQITPTPLVGRSSISMKVTADSGESINIGESLGTVASDGYPLYNRESLQMDLTDADSIYAVATAAGQILYVLEMA